MYLASQFIALILRYWLIFFPRVACSIPWALKAHGHTQKVDVVVGSRGPRVPTWDTGTVG